MSSKENFKPNPPQNQNYKKKKNINTKNIFKKKQNQNKLKNSKKSNKATYVLKLSKKTQSMISPSRKNVKNSIITISLKNINNNNNQISPNREKQINNNKKLSISNILNTNQVLYRNKDYISYKKQNRTTNSLLSKTRNENNSFHKISSHSIKTNLNKKNVIKPNSIINYSHKNFYLNSTSRESKNIHPKNRIKKNHNSIHLIKNNILLTDYTFNKYSKNFEPLHSVNNIIVPEKSEYFKEKEKSKDKKDKKENVEKNNILKPKRNCLFNSPKIELNSLKNSIEKNKKNKPKHKRQKNNINEKLSIYSIFHSPSNSYTQKIKNKIKLNNLSINSCQSFSNQKGSFVSTDNNKQDKNIPINKTENNIINNTTTNNNPSLSIIKETKKFNKKDGIRFFGKTINIKNKNVKKNLSNLNNKKPNIYKNYNKSNDNQENKYKEKEKGYLSCSNNNRNVKKSKLKLIKGNINTEKCNNILTLSKSVSNQNKNIFNGKIENYQITKELGKGSYATVKLATHQITKKKYALKKYTKKSLLNRQKRNTVKNEIDILKQLDHINIMKLFEIIDTNENLYLVLEYIKGGSLLDIIKKETNHIIEEKRAIKLFLQIVEGISYCHDKNICHRDIKLENILVIKNDIIKIIDFGFAIKSDLNTYNKLFCGTPSYMSPEIVSRQNYIAQYSEIWSLGVLLFAMLYGRFPFKGKNEEDLFVKIKEADLYFPDDKVIISNKIKKLFEMIFVVEPTKRPSLEEIKKYLNNEI